MPATAATGGSTSDDASTTTTAKKTQRTAPVSAKRRVANRVLTARDIAMRQRGDAYAYGAAGPDALRLLRPGHYSYRRAGFSLPRTSGAQAGQPAASPRRTCAPAT